MSIVRTATLRRAIAFALTILALVPVHALADGLASAAFLQPADLVPLQGFGFAVAASGNTIAIGTQFAPFAVYVYLVNEDGSVTQQAKLTSPTGSTTDRFGASLAIQGTTIVVGAPGAHVAYVYSGSNGVWAVAATLAPNGGSGAGFAGSPLGSLSMSSNTLAVSAPGEVTDAGQTGAVYIYTVANGVWAQQARITPGDPLVAGFGDSVSLQNDLLAIGAPFTQSPLGSQPGTAFVYARGSNGWSEAARLDPGHIVPFALYGQSVSLDGNTIVVGDQQPSEAEVFVDQNGMWSLQQILVGPEDSDFGTQVRVIGDLLMVTAYEDVSPAGVQSGTAHAYTRGGSTWTEQTDLLLAPGVHGIPGPPQGGQRFGNLAAMTKNGSETVFVFSSQTYSTDTALHVGAAYTAILK